MWLKPQMMNCWTSARYSESLKIMKYWWSKYDVCVSVCQSVSNKDVWRIQLLQASEQQTFNISFIIIEIICKSLTDLLKFSIDGALETQKHLRNSCALTALCDWRALWQRIVFSDIKKEVKPWRKSRCTF